MECNTLPLLLMYILCLVKVEWGGHLWEIALMFNMFLLHLNFVILIDSPFSHQRCVCVPPYSPCIIWPPLNRYAEKDREISQRQ